MWSQAGEDGVIEYIFDNIGTTNKFCVEFGAMDGKILSNTMALCDKGWDRLLIDIEPIAEPEFDIKQETLTAENINDVFAKYNCPEKFDLLSIDVDGNDYWLWKALNYNSRVVIIEYNPMWGPGDAKTIKYDPDYRFMETNYYGASVLAFKKLGIQKGMKLVFCNQLNAFFVDSSLLPDDFDYPVPPKKAKLGWPRDKTGREWVRV